MLSALVRSTDALYQCFRRGSVPNGQWLNLAPFIDDDHCRVAHALFTVGCLVLLFEIHISYHTFPTQPNSFFSIPHLTLCRLEKSSPHLDNLFTYLALQLQQSPLPFTVQPTVSPPSPTNRSTLTSHQSSSFASNDTPTYI